MNVIGLMTTRENSMSGRNFPVVDARLTEAAKLIDAVIDDYWDDVYSGDDGQYDNSASDGGSLALLGLARSLIQKETRKV